MSMTATGGPWSSRPCAPFLMASSGPRRRLRAVEAAYKAARRGFLERFATARQARIGHEILVGVEGFLARGGFYAIRGAVGQSFQLCSLSLNLAPMAHRNSGSDLAADNVYIDDIYMRSTHAESQAVQ